MSSTDNMCSVTSVSLTIRHLTWLRENETNRSALFRRLLDAHIEDVEGFGVSIQRLERERDEAAHRVRELEGELAVLYEQQRAFASEKDGDREERIRRLREELSVGA